MCPKSLAVDVDGLNAAISFLNDTVPPTSLAYHHALIIDSFLKRKKRNAISTVSSWPQDGSVILGEIMPRAEKPGEPRNKTCK